MNQREKDITFMGAVCIAFLMMAIVVLMVTKVRDRQVAIEVVNVERAKKDIEGYYDMYSKGLTQHSRDLTVKRIKEDFKGFDATLITNPKYRNFLINTRDN